MIAVTYGDVKILGPSADCLERAAQLFGGAEKWAGRKVTAAEARDAGATLNDIMWVASAIARTDPDIERRLRFWLADCAAHVLHIFEGDYPSDMRPREVIMAARRFARGEIDEAAWEAANDAAWDEIWDDAWGSAWLSAGEGAWVGASSAASMAAGGAVGAAEKQWQFDRLAAWLGDDEPEEWPLPEAGRSRT